VFKPNFSSNWHTGPQPLTWRKYEFIDKDTGGRDEISSCCTWRHRADQRNKEKEKKFESILPKYKEYKIAEMISSGIYNK
jgi:hypothetical protein